MTLEQVETPTGTLLVAKGALPANPVQRADLLRSAVKRSETGCRLVAFEDGPCDGQLRMVPRGERQIDLQIPAREGWDGGPAKYLVDHDHEGKEVARYVGQRWPGTDGLYGE